MPKPHPAQKHDHEMVDVWSVEGQFAQLIYSPKGAIEGVLITTDDVPTQFVTDPQDPAIVQLFAAVKPGQALVIEGIEAGPSPKGEAAHTVYLFERLVSVDGKDAAPVMAPRRAGGTVVRLNYAKHGEANGVVLDTGDFVHTKPDGLARLGLKVGDKVTAEGPSRALVTGHGRVIDAHSVNGEAVGPAR